MFGWVYRGECDGSSWMNTWMLDGVILNRIIYVDCLITCTEWYELLVWMDVWNGTQSFFLICSDYSRTQVTSSTTIAASPSIFSGRVVPCWRALAPWRGAWAHLGLGPFGGWGSGPFTSFFLGGRVQGPCAEVRLQFPQLKKRENTHTQMLLV
jgi:hypothetical protein